MRNAPACSGRPGTRASSALERTAGSASGANPIHRVGRKGAAGVRQRDARILVTDLELELARVPRQHRRPASEAVLGLRTACAQIHNPPLARDGAGRYDDQHVATGDGVVEPPQLVRVEHRRVAVREDNDPAGTGAVGVHPELLGQRPHRSAWWGMPQSLSREFEVRVRRRIERSYHRVA